MAAAIEPLQVPSLKDACITRLEELILSGEFKIGKRLPSERKLAERLNINRPVVHEALVDLTGKGLVGIVPRRGVFVNDFHTTGSCALLSALLAYHEGDLHESFFTSLADMRLLMETETTRLAALNHTEAQRRRFREILAEEAAIDRSNADRLAELDFAFHRRLVAAIAEGDGEAAAAIMAEMLRHGAENP